MGLIVRADSSPDLFRLHLYMHKGYKAVIGLEIHAQLASKSKIYCPDPVEFGGRANTRVSPISLGHPGTLPTFNAACLDLAIKMGLATGCQIADTCYFARKNYFYPDLPKGYQISQDKTPICIDGQIELRLKDGAKHLVRIQRIHMEEDAGKSLHDQDLYDTLIDLNRASVGLIEIVSHPDMSTAEQAMAYLTEIRKIVRYLDICDGNMEEGSLRCDANVSVMKIDATEFGTRAEVKNMNSISNVGRAINYEIERQINLIESGGTVARETRTWDATQGITLPMRDKENADDYRYFPEPDLQPLRVTQDHIARLRDSMPPLPETLFVQFTQEHGLPEHDATLLTEQREFAHYYLDATRLHANHKGVSNWMNGAVKSYLNENAVDITEFPVTPGTLARLVQLIDDGKISHTAARDGLFPVLLQQSAAAAGTVLDVEALARQENLLLERNDDALKQQIAEVLDAHPDQVAQYLGGKEGLLGFLVGKVMRASGGKMDPKVVNQFTREALEARKS